MASQRDDKAPHDVATYVRLTKAQRRDLELIAERDDRDLSYVIRRAVVDLIEREAA